MGVAPVSASAKGVKREGEGCASLSCAVGLLPPLFVSAKWVITIKGGLCSSVKRERQSFGFVLKTFLFSI